MNRTFTRLMLSTALCVPMATTVAAQTTTESCQQLEEILNSDNAQMFDDAERIEAVIQADDAAACDVELVAVEAVETDSTSDSANNSDSASEGAQLTETENLTVDLQDQVTVQGMVYLDRQPAEVDLQEGQTDVTVSDRQPDVTVTEGQAEIIVRQAPANVTVMMTQPTIRIEQPAPEIIITMPEPGVDIADSQPTVEVRQAEPTVTVMQAAPMVNLELRPAPEGEDGSMQVTDNASGQTMNAGESGEPMELSDTTVNVTSSEPNIVYETGEGNAPTINRSEPTVTFESAEPQVTVEQNGEATIEMVQTGEPTVTIHSSSEGGNNGNDPSNTDASNADSSDGSDTQAAAAMSDGNTDGDVENAVENAGQETAEAAGDVAQATENAAENAAAETEQTAEDAAAAAEQAAEDAEQTAEDATQEMDQATDEAAMATEDMANDAEQSMDSIGANGPDVQMDGFSPVALDALTGDMLENAPLYGSEGDQIGEVGQVLIGDNGMVNSLVLRVGGFLGLGEHAVEVPMDSLSVLSDGNGSIRVYIDETQDRLEDMPRYRN